MSGKKKKERDEDSEDEDMEAMVAAMRELLKIPDLEDQDEKKRIVNMDLEKFRNISKDSQVHKSDQGAQTDENSNKSKSAIPDKSPSDESWANSLLKRWGWSTSAECPTIEVRKEIKPESRLAIDGKDESQPIARNKGPPPKTKRKSASKSPSRVKKYKSSTDMSREFLIRSDRYDLHSKPPELVADEAKPSSKANQSQTVSSHDLDSDAANDSEDTRRKLSRIEEASKPKSWVKPKPIFIKSKEGTSTATNANANNDLSKPQTKAEPTNRIINILKGPFRGSLSYAPGEGEHEKNESRNRESQTESHKKSPKDNLSAEKESNATSPKRKDDPSSLSLVIKGHSHITSELTDHCHLKHYPEKGIDRAAKKKLIIASCVCLFFMIIMIIGGLWSKSLAIATDASHLLTDLAGFMISLFAIYLAGRPASKRLNFGWYRAEIIGAMFSVYFIWIVTGRLDSKRQQKLVYGCYSSLYTFTILAAYRSSVMVVTLVASSYSFTFLASYIFIILKLKFKPNPTKSTHHRHPGLAGCPTTA